MLIITKIKMQNASPTRRPAWRLRVARRGLGGRGGRLGGGVEQRAALGVVRCVDVLDLDRLAALELLRLDATADLVLGLVGDPHDGVGAIAGHLLAVVELQIALTGLVVGDARDVRAVATRCGPDGQRRCTSELHQGCLVHLEPPCATGVSRTVQVLDNVQYSNI